MQVLPSGLVVPPLPYLAALLVAGAAVAAALSRLRPPVTEWTVLATAPWMVLGGMVHGFEQFDLVPAALVPLATAPAVYLSVAVLAGAVWAAAAAAADGTGATARALGNVGGLGVLAFGAVAYADALGRVPTGTLFWPAVGAVGAAAVTAPVVALLRRRRPGAVETAGVAGLVAVFAHALDGVTTAIGVDVVGTGERTPIPRMIMDFAGTLPTAPYLGRGWLFVLVKLAVAAGIVVLLADYAAEEPTEGNLLFVLVAAVGLGPAANNLTLFLLTGGI